MRLPVAVVTLAAVLGLLATLQYRWVGQVAEAERARLQAGARTRVEQLAEDFDREVTRAFAWLQVDADMLTEGGGERFAARYEKWAGRTDHAGLVAAVYVTQDEPRGHVRLRRFDPASRQLVDADWPDALQALRPQLEDPGGDRPRPGPPGYVTENGPALVIPIFRRGAEAFEWPPRGHSGPRLAGHTVVLLDRGHIERRLLPALATRYFATGGEFDDDVVVRTRRDPRAVVYRSGPEAGERRAPDASSTLLEVHFDQVESGALLGGDPAAPTALVRRAGPREAFHPPPPGPGPRAGAMDRGRWEVAVTHRAGSLEQVVAVARRRNLAISFGTLLLLAASAAMILVSSQRARRLAAQQVEFVAGVSHELRTPIAVVCSAGENLADGIVRDPAEVRVYGATIRDEGRRLAEMVEQVLEFAGIASRERRRAREPIAVARLVEDALEACAAAVADGGFQVEVGVAAGLPLVVGDRAALRRALQNLVQNAVRHARGGRWIGITAEPGRAGRTVRLTVRDRGPGIPTGEEALLFRPFFRGRQALASGVTGSGLGLSLVQRIVEAHGGTVEVDSAPGAGSAFTLVLPAAPEGRQVSAVGEGDAQADPAR